MQVELNAGKNVEKLFSAESLRRALRSLILFYKTRSQFHIIEFQNLRGSGQTLTVKYRIRKIKLANFINIDIIKIVKLSLYFFEDSL